MKNKNKMEISVQEKKQHIERSLELTMDIIPIMDKIMTLSRSKVHKPSGILIGEYLTLRNQLVKELKKILQKQKGKKKKNET